MSLIIPTELLLIGGFILFMLGWMALMAGILRGLDLIFTRQFHDPDDKSDNE